MGSMFKIILILIVLGGVSFCASAQSRSLPFLEFNADTRTSGMGDAFIGDARGMYLYTNPTSFLYKERKLYVSYAFGLYPKTDGEARNYHAVSSGLRLGKQAFMVGFRYMKNIPFRSIGETGIEGKMSYPRDWVVDVAFVRDLGEHFSTFLGGSFVQSFVKKVAYSWGLNGGLYYRNSLDVFKNDVSCVVGLSFHDVGGKVKYGKGVDVELPASVALGGSMAMSLSKDHKINFAATGRYFMLPSSASEFTIGWGAEYECFKVLFLRAGFHHGESLNYATVGLGGCYGAIALDVSYQIAESSRHINVFKTGLSYQF